MTCELKKLKPENIEVGDICFIPNPYLENRLMVAKVIEIDKNGIQYASIHSSRDRLPVATSSILLMKKREKKLEFYAGEDILRHLIRVESGMLEAIGMK